MPVGRAGMTEHKINPNAGSIIHVRYDKLSERGVNSPAPNMDSAS